VSAETVAQRIAHALRRHGVDVIFAQSLPSAVVLACEAIGIRQVAYRQENMGGAMADGYARISGRIAVVCAQNGPAATLHHLFDSLTMVRGSPADRGSPMVWMLRLCAQMLPSYAYQHAAWNDTVWSQGSAPSALRRCYRTTDNKPSAMSSEDPIAIHNR
jgi:hypothetical protein